MRNLRLGIGLVALLVSGGLYAQADSTYVPGLYGSPALSNSMQEQQYIPPATVTPWGHYFLGQSRVCESNSVFIDGGGAFYWYNWGGGGWVYLGHSVGTAPITYKGQIGYTHFWLSASPIGNGGTTPVNWTMTCGSMYNNTQDGS